MSNTGAEIEGAHEGFFNMTQFPRVGFDQFENNRFPNSYLLGDRGYRAERYLLTPLSQPNNRAEERYNSSHIRTRNTVERQYGLWKRRFPVLQLGMIANIDLAKRIAVAVLHNIALTVNNPVPEDIYLPYEEPMMYIYKMD